MTLQESGTKEKSLAQEIGIRPSIPPRFCAPLIHQIYGRHTDPIRYDDERQETQYLRRHKPNGGGAEEGKTEQEVSIAAVFEDEGG